MPSFRRSFCALITLNFWLSISLTASAASLIDIKTVFVIVMENHNWEAIKDSSHCPYINNYLLPSASYATSYFSPAGVHPSEPNYIWMEAGTNYGIYDDGVHVIDSTNHLTSMLDGAGISWRSYQESMTGDVYPIVDYYPFAIRHCPQLHFKDVISDSGYCLQHIRPYSELANDLSLDRVARYNFITPNLTNDMHDVGPGFTSARASGDYWLSNEVPKILSSDAFQDNGALFITWDEGTAFTDGPMGMIVLSPLGKGHGYFNSIPYTHSSTLRTMQTIFGLRPFLGDAANADGLGDLFAIFSMRGALSADRTKFTLTIDGIKAGQVITIDRSPDLVSWTSWSTNTAASNTLVVGLEHSSLPLPQEYFRAALQP